MSPTPIDIATNTAGPPIGVGDIPTAIAITPDGATAYVANGGSDTVTPIDIATNTAGPPIGAGTIPFGIAITPDGATAYVTNILSDNLTPIHTATNTAGPPIAVGDLPRGIAISPCTIIGTAATEQAHGNGGRRRDLRPRRQRQINGGGSDESIAGGGRQRRDAGVRGDDTLDGGAGNNDSANYPRANQAVEVDLSTGVVADDGRGFAETVANVERVTGATNQANTITGDDAKQQAGRRPVGRRPHRRRRGGHPARRIRARRHGRRRHAHRRGRRQRPSSPGWAPTRSTAGRARTPFGYDLLVTAAGVDIIAVPTESGTKTRWGRLTDNFTAVEGVTGTANDGRHRGVAWNGVVSAFRGARRRRLSSRTIDGDTLDTMGGGAGVNSCANPDPDTAINC